MTRADANMYKITSFNASMKGGKATGVSVWRGGYSTVSKLTHTDLEASVTVKGSEGDMHDSKASEASRADNLR